MFRKASVRYSSPAADFTLLNQRRKQGSSNSSINFSKYWNPEPPSSLTLQRLDDDDKNERLPGTELVILNSKFISDEELRKTIVSARSDVSIIHCGAIRRDEIPQNILALLKELRWTVYRTADGTLVAFEEDRRLACVAVKASIVRYLGSGAYGWTNEIALPAAEKPVKLALKSVDLRRFPDVGVVVKRELALDLQESAMLSSRRAVRIFLHQKKLRPRYEYARNVVKWAAVFHHRIVKLRDDPSEISQAVIEHFINELLPFNTKEENVQVFTLFGLFIFLLEDYISGLVGAMESGETLTLELLHFLEEVLVAHQSQSASLRTVLKKSTLHLTGLFRKNEVTAALYNLAAIPHASDEEFQVSSNTPMVSWLQITPVATLKLISAAYECSLAEALVRWPLLSCPWKDSKTIYYITVAMLLLFEQVSGLHGAGLVHRDIKPANVLIRLNSEEPGKFCFVLTDFSVMKQLDDEQKRELTTGIGGYIAPEAAFESDYDEKIDVYSLGILFYKILFGENANLDELQYTIEDGLEVIDFPVSFSRYYPDQCAIIKQMTLRDPSLRDSVVDAHDELLPFGVLVKELSTEDDLPRSITSIQPTSDVLRLDGSIVMSLDLAVPNEFSANLNKWTDVYLKMTVINLVDSVPKWECVTKKRKRRMKKTNKNGTAKRKKRSSLDVHITETLQC